MSKNPASVVKLVPKDVVRSEGCISALENMLALARDGVLVGVAIAAFDAEGCTHTAYEGGGNLAMLIGATERVKNRLLVE